jgi:hypothetical protein
MSRFTDLFQEPVPEPVVETAPEPVVETAPEPVVEIKKTKKVYKKVN